MKRELTQDLDVIIVGSGLSGISAARYLQSKSPWASFAILEARDSIGGTWDLFRFPGIRSDSDMYTLGYSFKPWNGHKTIADGSSILEYIKEAATETGVESHIKFNHRVVRAEWRTDDARWHLDVQRTDTGERAELSCGFLFSCAGYFRYDRGHLPEFAGSRDFRGPVIHPQRWPEGLDYEGKRIVVIGSGSTAVTLVPALARSAEHVTMLQRSPSYVGVIPSENVLDGLLERVLPTRWSGTLIRWLHALMMQGFYQLSRRRPQLVKRTVRAELRRHLPEGYDIDTHFSPTYDPWDQRFCVAPDGDLFQAIRSDKASVVTDCIERFTEHGLALSSGAELEADLIVTATGLELLFLGGIDVTVDGETIDLSTKLTYKGMMLQDVPNLALAVGYTNASWTLKCELTCDYVSRLLNHMRERGYVQCTPVNLDASVVAEPVMGLTSGYILRSAHKFPKQGSKFPWRVHQSYLRDYRALKLGGVEDGALIFSKSAPSKTTEASWVHEAV